MRHHARLLVMRYGPPMGWPAAPWRVSIAYHAGTLDDAFAWLTHRGDRVFWIAAREAPAHRPRPRARRRAQPGAVMARRIVGNTRPS